MVEYRDYTYSYKSVPTLYEFSKSNAFFRGIIGPIGSGKSSASIIEIAKRGQEQKPGPDGIRHTRWVVVRNTYPMLRDTTMKSFFQWFPPQHFGNYTSGTKTYTIKHFPGCEIEILFRALDRPDDIRSLLSLEVTGAFINEGREVPWPIYDAMQGRLGRFPAQVDGGPSWYGMWADTNPPDVDSDWFRFFEETKHDPEMVQLFHQPSGLADNAENLPNLPGGREYYTKLLVGKKPEWVKVYIHGEYGFVIDGKPVYSEYSDTLHQCESSPVEGVPIHRGWDFGLTPACAFSQLLPDGRFLVFDEMRAKDLGFDRFSDDVLDHCSRAFKGNVEFIDDADPAGAQRSQADETTCFDIASAKGINMDPSEQDPLLRMESLRKPMRTLVAGEPQFLLHPRCQAIRKGLLGGYQLRRIQVAGPERFASRPDKGPLSHIMNALEYTAARLFASTLTTMPHEDQFGNYHEQINEQTGRSQITGY